MDHQELVKPSLPVPSPITLIVHLFVSVVPNWFKSLLARDREWSENCLSWPVSTVQVSFSWTKLIPSVPLAWNLVAVVILRYNWSYNQSRVFILLWSYTVSFTLSRSNVQCWSFWINSMALNHNKTSKVVVQFQHQNYWVLVIMATNRIDILDSALLRPGRIDRKIEFPAPNEDVRHLVSHKV